MASTTGARRPVRFAGMSPDQRRAERRRLLLDTAFDLLASEGWGGTSVRAICAANDLNPRYFYENFENLDALVVAVYDRLLDELRHTLVGALDAAPPDLPSPGAGAVRRAARQRGGQPAPRQRRLRADVIPAHRRQEPPARRSERRPDRG